MAFLNYSQYHDLDANELFCLYSLRIESDRFQFVLHEGQRLLVELMMEPKIGWDSDLLVVEYNSS